MKHAIIQRTEMLEATLDLGGATPFALADYATTGIRAACIASSGSGKTATGLLFAEQLVEQGWISVLIDAEGEIASLYGDPVADPEALRKRMLARDQRFIVVSATDAAQFIPYGEVILEVVDSQRKPVLVVLDEGQLFSSGKKRQENVGEASDIIQQLSERGRKRLCDVFITAHRYTGTVHRSVFANSNITLVGAQSDPAAWSALAPHFRAAHIEFGELAALQPGQFFCISRRGVEKLSVPMPEALRKVARKATAVKPVLPRSYSEWDRALRAIPDQRLHALSEPVVALLGAVAGLSAQQMRSGARALADELDARA